MKRKPKVMPRGVKQIIDLFELFLDYYMTGLLCFFSENEPFPDAEQLSELAKSPYITGQLDTRVQGGPDIPYAQILVERMMPIERILQRHGGLERWRRIFALYEAVEPTCARTLRDLSNVGGLEYRNLEMMADAHCTTVGTIRRRKQRGLMQLAFEIYKKDEDGRLRGHGLDN